VSIPQEAVTFRPLDRTDFVRLERWLREPHVLTWWREPLDLAGLETKYGPRIDGDEPTQVFVIEYQRGPVGWIQWYRWCDYETHARKIDAGSHEAGVDLAIGDPRVIGIGLGPIVLGAFLRQVVFADPSVSGVVCDPEVLNVRSRRAFEKAGFRSVGVVVLDGETEAREIVRLNRTDTITVP
jgi:RimJ/RimL family protein N-acetyltransferase